MLEKVTFLKHVEAFKDCFSLAFEKRFGAKPLLEPEDNVHFNWAIDKLGFEKASELIEIYFSIEDEWIKNQGFPISLFRKQINRVIASSGALNAIERPWYVVGFSENGFPILSRNPQSLKEEFPKWKPLLWVSWLEQSKEGKFQLPMNIWAIGKNKPEEWLKLWVDRGWVKVS